MVKTIHLYGHLAEQFGAIHKMAADSVADIVALMEANYGNFRKALLNGRYAILRGESIDNFDENLTENQLTMKFKEGDWHIIPEGCGAGGNGGIFQFILGAAIAVVGVYTGNTELIRLGVGLMLIGVATMLTPVVGEYEQKEVDEKASLLYNGGANVNEQGNPVPICYGQVMAGSVVVSADVDIFEFAGQELGADGVVTDF